MEMPFMPRSVKKTIGGVTYTIQELLAVERDEILFESADIMGQSLSFMVEGYFGEAEPEEVGSHGWRWLEVPCAHCGHVHQQLAPEHPLEHLRCRQCGWHPSTP